MTTVRMPPSPTGSLHLGTARTALFNWLFAKKNGGKIVFRWEDTDKERSKPEFETEILKGLQWLGMDFERECAPLGRQTENTPHYEAALKTLWESGKIFPCFVTEAEINQQREAAQKAKQNFVFWSSCRDWDQKKSAEKMDAGDPFVWRLRVPQNQTITFSDVIKGDITTNSAIIGDIAIARKDGSVLYLLANVVDDHRDGVTHIIRGEDHISNTPKQILIAQALEIPAFLYAHIPLVLDTQKRKLSKRNVLLGVCVLVEEFKSAGFIPEGVINGLAMLGWNPKTTEEFFTLPDLESRFDLSQVNAAAAQYDFEKMKFFNHYWLRTLPAEKSRDYFYQWNQEFGVEKNDYYQTQPAVIEKALPLVLEKTKTLHEVPHEISYFFSAEKPTAETFLSEKMNIDSALCVRVLQTLVDQIEATDEFNFTAERIRTASLENIAKMELKNGQFLWPFRVALSGREKSAGPFEIAEIIGKEETLLRLRTAQKTATMKE